MNYTISDCLVKSQLLAGFPNGNLTTAGNVSYFANRHASADHNPVKVSDIRVINENGVEFFSRKAETSVKALRAIANGLLEIADSAEKAHARMKELNGAE